MNDAIAQPSPAVAPTSSDVRAGKLNARVFVARSFIGSVVVAAILAAVLALVGRPDWWRGYAAGVVAGFASLLASALPVTALFRHPLPTLLGGFMVAGVLRAVVLGTIVILAIRVGGYPENPTLLFAGLMYFAMVSIEGFLLWQMVGSGPITVASPHAPSPLPNLTKTRELA